MLYSLYNMLNTWLLEMCIFTPVEWYENHTFLYTDHWFVKFSLLCVCKSCFSWLCGICFYFHNFFILFFKINSEWHVSFWCVVWQFLTCSCSVSPMKNQHDSCFLTWAIGFQCFSVILKVSDSCFTLNLLIYRSVIYN